MRWKSSEVEIFSVCMYVCVTICACACASSFRKNQMQSKAQTKKCGVAAKVRACLSKWRSIYAYVCLCVNCPTACRLQCKTHSSDVFMPKKEISIGTNHTPLIPDRSATQQALRWLGITAWRCRELIDINCWLTSSLTAKRSKNQWSFGLLGI